MWRGVTHSANTDVRSARFCDSILPGRKVKILHTCVHLAQNISSALISSWPHLDCPAYCMLDIWMPFVSFVDLQSEPWAQKVKNATNKTPSPDPKNFGVYFGGLYFQARFPQETEKGLRAVSVYNLHGSMFNKPTFKTRLYKTSGKYVQRRQSVLTMQC